MELRLSEQKITDLRAELMSWGSRSSCKKRKLQSLIGVVNHACRVVKPGRSFLQRLIDLSCVRKHPEDWIRLNDQARSDIDWWRAFAATWNGRSICASSWASEYSMVSDTSGSWGCGAYFKHRWFQLHWLDQDTREAHSTVKDATIKLLGRWESAAAYLLYVKTPREELARFTAVLSRSPRSSAPGEGTSA